VAVSAMIADISVHGCYVETLQPFPMGTALELTFNVAESSVCVIGTVCSVHPCTGMGITFEHVDEPNRERLERIVNAQKERGVGESF